jgi:hypothetical protein
MTAARRFATWGSRRAPGAWPCEAACASAHMPIEQPRIIRIGRLSDRHVDHLERSPNRCRVGCDREREARRGSIPSATRAGNSTPSMPGSSRSHTTNRGRVVAGSPSARAAGVDEDDLVVAKRRSYIASRSG